jgi:hypothetical protein
MRQPVIAVMQPTQHLASLRVVLDLVLAWHVDLVHTYDSAAGQRSVEAFETGVRVWEMLEDVEGNDAVTRPRLDLIQGLRQQRQ